MNFVQIFAKINKRKILSFFSGCVGVFVLALIVWQGVAFAGAADRLPLNAEYDDKQTFNDSLTFENFSAVLGDVILNNSGQAGVAGVGVRNIGTGSALEVFGNFKIGGSSSVPGKLKLYSDIVDNIPANQERGTIYGPDNNGVVIPPEQSKDTCNGQVDAKYDTCDDKDRNYTYESCEDYYRRGDNYYVRTITCASPDNAFYEFLTDSSGTLKIKNHNNKTALAIGQDGRVGFGTDDLSGAAIVKVGTFPGSDSLYVNKIHYKMDPGNSYQTGLVDNTNAAPKGMIMYFNKTECPLGWSEPKNGNDYMARGRYFVSLPIVVENALDRTPIGPNQYGNVGAVIDAGNSLTDKENRMAGSHGHGINDPGHSHLYQRKNENDKQGDDTGGNASASDTMTHGKFTGGSGLTNIQNTGGATLQGQELKDSTPAPYIQLLACEKE